MRGHLYQRGGTWWGRLRREGQELRRSLRTRSRPEAKRRLDAWAAEVEQAAFTGQGFTWGEAAGKFITETLPELVKPTTAARYLVSLKAVRPILDGKTLKQIDRATVAEIARREGVSNATRRRDLTAVSAVLRAAVTWGWIDANPAREWDRAVIPERRGPIDPPSDAEIKAIIARCPPAFGRLVAFLAWTGMRQEEAAGLEWRQVDTRRGLVTLTRTKGGRARTVALLSPGGDARGTIRGTPREPGQAYVFRPEAGGDRFANVASRFREIMRRAERAGGKDFRAFRCHDLRHAFAVRWLREGGDLYALSRHLGHSSVKVTELYLGYAGAQTGAQTIAVSKRPKPRRKRVSG